MKKLQQVSGVFFIELELELIQTQMAQKVFFYLRYMTATKYPSARALFRRGCRAE